MPFIKKMRSFFIVLFVILLWQPQTICAAEKQTIDANSIHALSAVLLDGDSGRVLYEKEGECKRANASTTKIMTCILALENGKEDDIVTVSAYAASMPNVQLNIEEGEQYYLKDLLYSLMLESHNDSAVAIAEHIGGSVEGFSALMNEKAKELGCSNTCFLTPNGLDASVGEDTHGTTAHDLALIMRYCSWQSPRAERFLEITQTNAYSFTSLTEQADGSMIPGTRNFSCTNHNAYLSQNPDCLSGKTGFTADAGYCYVTSLSSGGRKFVIALLASGWPNNKTYKWQDCNKIYQYATTYYQMRKVMDPAEGLQSVRLQRAQNPDYDLKTQKSAMPQLTDMRKEVLLADWETMAIRLHYPRSIEATGKGIRAIGNAELLVDDVVIDTCDILLEDNLAVKNMPWFFQAILKKWAMFF